MCVLICNISLVNKTLEIIICKNVHNLWYESIYQNLTNWLSYSTKHFECNIKLDLKHGVNTCIFCLGEVTIFPLSLENFSISIWFARFGEQKNIFIVDYSYKVWNDQLTEFCR